MNENNSENEERALPLAVLIQEAITAAQSRKGDQSVDKKWLNKTVARLEEAQVFADRAEGNVQGLNIPAAKDNFACTCPAGVIDTVDCPVHKRK